MDQNPLDRLGGCPRCGGKGLGRNPKHFFYGICLIGSGVMALFQWWPAPEVFDFIREIFVSLKLSPWFGIMIWDAATGRPMRPYPDKLNFLRVGHSLCIVLWALLGGLLARCFHATHATDSLEPR